MSNTALIESQSSDRVVRAIARRVLRILNDPTLDRLQRVDLVRTAQHDLLQHQAQVHREAALATVAETAVLPKGWQARSVQSSDGRVQVGVVNRTQGFAWLDAGQVPQGISSGHGVQALRISARSQKQGQATNATLARRRA